MTSASSRVLVLDGHPGATSLCAGLASAAAEAAQARGAEVRLLHLSAMAFDPNLASGYKTRQEMEPATMEYSHRRVVPRHRPVRSPSG